MKYLFRCLSECREWEVLDRMKGKEEEDDG